MSVNTKYPVQLSLPELRAAIRGLTDTAGVAPLEALRAYLADEDVTWDALTGNEDAALHHLLATYVAGCEAAAVDPYDWAHVRSPA